MSKLILCRGRYAKHPYYMEIGNANIYSIEELSYYMVSNLDLVIELDYNKSLFEWIRDELELEDLAENLLKLKEEKVNNKILIQTILNSSNYYSNAERIKISQTIESLENLPVLQRKILKANQFLATRHFKEAESDYEAIINGDKADELGAKEYAQILNNLGISKMYTVGIKEASLFFKQAYERNNENESLRQYFLSLKLSNQEELFDEEVVNYDLSKEWILELEKELNNYINEYESSNNYQEVLRLRETSDNDQSSFLGEARKIAMDLESKYRRSINGNT